MWSSFLVIAEDSNSDFKVFVTKGIVILELRKMHYVWTHSEFYETWNIVYPLTYFFTNQGFRFSDSFPPHYPIKARSSIRNSCSQISFFLIYPEGRLVQPTSNPVSVFPFSSASSCFNRELVWATCWWGQELTQKKTHESVLVNTTTGRPVWL